MFKLRNSASPSQAIWLVEPQVTIGSGAGSDLVLTVPGLAQKHIEISIDFEDLQLTVLQDGVAVTVNGREVARGDAPVKLSLSDAIKIGQVELEVIDPKFNKETTVPEIEEKSSPAQEDTGWALKANHSALANRVYALSDTTLIGRSNECDIVLAAAHLSRRHALLTIRNDKLHVKDLDSANGTFVNGKKVTESWLRRGDQLKFDTLSFGVMGPAEEMDKTSVRAVSPELIRAAQQAKEAAAKADAAAARKPVAPQASVKSSASSSGQAAAPAPRASVRPEPVEVSQTSTGRRLGIGLGLLIIIAAGIYVVSTVL